MRTIALQIFLLVFLFVIGSIVAIQRFFFSPPSPVPPQNSTQASSEPKKIASSQVRTIQSVLQAADEEPEAGSCSTFDVEKFRSYGFPDPQEPNPVTLDPEGLKRWKAYGVAAAVKAGELVDIDPGIIGYWSFAEGINYDLTFNVCGPQNENVGINAPCATNNWQAGNFAAQPANANNLLKEAFDAMYGGSDEATVKKVGQGVIDKVAQRHPGTTLTFPSSTFPSVSAQTLTSKFNSSETERAWVGHLSRDDEIGAYVQAKVFKATLGPGFADSILYGYGDKQKIINTIKAVHCAGLTGGSTTPGTGGSFGSIPTLNLVVQPKNPDIWVINQATGQVFGARGGTSPGGTGPGAPAGSVDGHCLPTGTYPSDLAADLRDKYKITLSGYDTEGTKMIFDVVTCISGSRFPSLLGRTTITIYNSGSPHMSCDVANKVCEIWMPTSLNAFKFILTHEMGHVLFYTNSHETMHFTEFENAWGKEGGLSPYSGPFKKDPSICGGKSIIEEDYAELVAYYYNPNSGGKTGACDTRENPPNSLFGTSDFPLHLDVAKAVL